MESESDSFWFKSPLFEIEPGEDEEINPCIYGRQLADWLAAKLRAKGYDTDVINEDWGRCIMCSRDPVWLWVGCANMQLTFPEFPEEPPKKEEIVWRCFVECEVPFWKRIFKRVPDSQSHKEKLVADLAAILQAEPQIQLVPEP